MKVRSIKRKHALSRKKNWRVIAIRRASSAVANSLKALIEAVESNREECIDRIKCSFAKLVLGK